MPRLLVNIDVDDLDRAIRFYTDAFGLTVGRRLEPDFVELIGAAIPLYLLSTPAESAPFEGATSRRTYERHWTPIHFDFVVDDLEAARARAIAAGARAETEITSHAWGRMVVFADPFGHGFCLLEFRGGGYDELVSDR